MSSAHHISISHAQILGESPVYRAFYEKFCGAIVKAEPSASAPKRTSKRRKSLFDQESTPELQHEVQELEVNHDLKYF